MYLKIDRVFSFEYIMWLALPRDFLTTFLNKIKKDLVLNIEIFKMFMKWKETHWLCLIMNVILLRTEKINNFWVFFYLLFKILNYILHRHRVFIVALVLKDFRDSVQEYNNWINNFRF